MKKVIMPEDIHELLSPEQSFLSRAGVVVLTADTNRRALLLHRAERADLIIAYLDTVAMSGEELCRTIREDDDLRRVSILLVCGENESDISRSMNCRANAYVTIPVVSAVLLQEAHRLLNIASRNTCRIPVEIKLECETRGMRFSGMIDNISMAGLLFRTSAELPEGSTVHCTFAASGSRRLTVSGEVVRVVPDGPEVRYGVSFFDISTEAAAAIKRLSKDKD